MKENKPNFIKRDSSIIEQEYVSMLKSLKSRFRDVQIKAAVKVNTALLEFYWSMGHDISRLHSESRRGSAFFDTLSLDLKAEFPTHAGFSSTNLKYIKRWFEFYNQGDVIRHQAGDEFEMPIEFGEVPWRHHIQIFTHSKSVAEALFYIEGTIKGGWSRSQLEVEMNNDLYEREGKVLTNFDEKLESPHSGLAKAILKSPYYFGFIDSKIQSERQLEEALVHNISRTLLELGSGFAFVGRQMELRMPGGQVFIPDMIFYHTKLKCYIVLELKTGAFIPEYAGKLNFYVSAVDNLMKEDDDKPTIGLLVCKSKDKTVVEWSFAGIERPLGVAEYKLKDEIDNISRMLPSESEIRKLIDTYDAE